MMDDKKDITGDDEDDEKSLNNTSLETLQYSYNPPLPQPRPFSKKLAIVSKDFAKLLFSALEISFGYVCMSVILTINLLFLGKSGDLDLLAAIGLGNVWLNFTAMHLIYGLNSGFEVIASKTFGRSHYLQFRSLKLKAATLILAILIFSFGLCFCVSPVFSFFGYSSKIVEPMTQYVFYSFPSIVLLAFFDLEVESLNSQGIFAVQFIIVLSSAFLHALWCYIFIGIYSLGIPGVALALTLTYATSLFLIKMSIYITNIDCTRKVPFEYSSILESDGKEWKKYFSKVIPVAVTVFFDIFSLELITLIAGGIKQPAYITVHVLYINLESFFYNFSEGYGSAIYSFVGNALGRGNIGEAKRWAKLGVSGCVTIVSLSCTLFIIFGDQIAAAMVNDDEVIRLFGETILYFVGYLVADSFFTSSSAVIMVMGYSKRVLLMSLLFSYSIQIPLIAINTLYFDLKLKGIWATMDISLLTEIIVLGIWVSNIQWRRGGSYDEEEAMLEKMTLEKSNSGRILFVAAFNDLNVSQSIGSVDEQDSTEFYSTLN